VSAAQRPPKKSPVFSNDAAGLGQLTNKYSTSVSATSTSSGDVGGGESIDGDDSASPRGDLVKETIAAKNDCAQDDISPVDHSVLALHPVFGDSAFEAGVVMASAQRTLLTLKDVVRREIFPHCKVVQSDEDLNDMSQHSLASVIMDKLNVHDTLRSGFWATVKYKVNKQLAHLRQQVNSKLRAAYFSKFKHIHET
jgi:hypothetical protein